MTAAPTGTNAHTLLRLTPTDEALLRACARYQYATVAQWCRFFADDGKRRYLQRRGRALAAQDFLLRLALVRPGGTGNAATLFTPGLAGRRHAAALGMRVPRRFRRSDLATLSPQHLAHSEAITDVLLSFDLLARHDTRIDIADMLHERFLHEQRFKVPLRTMRPLTGEVVTTAPEVIPDAFVRVIARLGAKTRRFPLLIEVDRDTEEQTAFREKIAKLHAFGTSETFARLYDARTFTVAFFIRAPRRDPLARLAEVLDWTERELRALRLEHDAEAFRFCALDPATTPATLLLGAQWFAPFSVTPQPLLDLSLVPVSEGGV
jgi:hypothetical protein